VTKEKKKKTMLLTVDTLTETTCSILRVLAMCIVSKASKNNSFNVFQHHISKADLSLPI
jgi:hypothetical protein